MLLNIGSQGDNVKKVQAHLNMQETGIYCLETKAQVKAWQLTHGLSPDGIVGEQTWGKLCVAAINLTISKRSHTQIKPETLKGIVPEHLLNQIQDNTTYSKLTDTLHLCHFLTQCAHESGNFTSTEENLNYSAQGLMATFPKYFDKSMAKEYAHQPIRIASRVYAGRLQNGDEESGDGWTYRGRGYIQPTGKCNYEHFANFIREDTVAHPDLIATKYPLMSAYYFFTMHDIWKYCDNASSENIKKITKIINGGMNGLTERIKLFNEYYSRAEQG
ncbi:peptidoglycan-binding protein [Cellvibrio sp.]|jgi:putative chitinase